MNSETNTVLPKIRIKPSVPVPKPSVQLTSTKQPADSARKDRTITGENLNRLIEELLTEQEKDLETKRIKAKTSTEPKRPEENRMSSYYKHKKASGYFLMPPELKDVPPPGIKCNFG